MKKTIHSSPPAIALTLAGIIGWNASAAVPTLPIHQQQGIPDGLFNNLSEPICRACHNQNPPPGIPVDPRALANRHHLRVGTAIPSPSDVPIPDANGDGVADTTFSCLSCHIISWNPATSSFVFVQNYRDCMNCHQQDFTGGVPQTTVHHKTALAQAANCKACHGGLVNNSDDGHTIPTYAPSLTTPAPSGKQNADLTLTSSAGTHPGSCNYCHNTADGLPGDPTKNLAPTWFGPTVPIYTNSENHHSTGLQRLGIGACMWCHDVHSVAAIRRCEGCHGMSSLHNIVADTNGDGVKPGLELPGYSHTGSPEDCWGCHGNNGGVIVGALSVAPTLGAGIASLQSVSTPTIKAGSESLVTLSGRNFATYLDDGTGTFPNYVKATVLLSSSSGERFELNPISVQESGLTVAIPATQAIGSYRIAVMKRKTGDPIDSESTLLSNPMSLTITPRASITSANCVQKKGMITVVGRNFGTALAADGSGTSITMNGLRGTVVSWSDTEIKARFPSCPKGPSVTVTTVFDSVSASVVVGLR